MPRFQLTVGRMMVVVAIAAVALGLEVGRRRRVVFLEIAAEHARQEQWSLELAVDSRELAQSARDRADQTRRRSFWGRLEAPAIGLVARQIEREVERSQEEAAYYATMKQKYDRAARFPWLPVAPDPPRP